MKKPPELKISEMQITQGEFLRSFNQHMPAAFPRATMALLNRFREAHTALFKHGDMWSLDLHRKKVMDWLPRNPSAS